MSAQCIENQGLQLPYITGERIGSQKSIQLPGYSGLFLFQSSCSLFQEKINQKRQICQPLPQGGNGNMMSHEPVVEVFAETPITLFVH
ncbi:hypothetical protein ES707_14247 [subsurface metagenome]